MKHLFEYSNKDYRDDMSDKTKEIHDNDAKEFYLVDANKYITKLSIPEELRGEFEEEYTGGDYGSFYKDTAEYIEYIAAEYESNFIIMDYEIDNFIKSLQQAKYKTAEE